MKKALTIILTFSLLTPAIAEDTCQCVTAECAAGLTPAVPHEVSYEEACLVSGTLACFAASIQIPPSSRTGFIAACQAGKTAVCIAMCN